VSLQQLFIDKRPKFYENIDKISFCYQREDYRYRKGSHANRHSHRRIGSCRLVRLELFDGLDNPTSIQLAIAKVACRIAANTLNPRQARSLLYALQLAANNVRNIKTTENSTVAPDIVEDFTWGHLAELEPSRIEPETLDKRLSRPKHRAEPEANNSKPFTGYYPDYKIPEEVEEVIRMKEGLSKTDPLFKTVNPLID